MTKTLIDSLKNALREPPKPKGHRVQPARERADEDPIYDRQDSVRGASSRGGIRVGVRQVFD